MKYFIDTHDRTKGSFPKEELTEQQFFDNFDALDAAAHKLGALWARRACQPQGRQGLLFHVGA